MDPDPDYSLPEEVRRALSSFVGINNDYVQSLVRALLDPGSTVKRRLTALVAFVSYIIYYHTLARASNDGADANGANSAQHQANECVSKRRKLKATSKSFVCDVCGEQTTKASGKRHREGHLISYICVWCLQEGREVHRIRYERLWEKHVFEEHRNRLSSDSVKQKPRSLGEWCALLCTSCGMRFAIRKVPDPDDRTALKEARLSLTKHCKWHETEASRSGWVARVALNGVLLEEHLVGVWNGLLEQYNLDGVNVIAGLTEACAKTCAELLAQPIGLDEVFGHLSWLLWAGTIRYDAEKADTVERPSIEGALTGYQVSLRDVANRIGNLAEDVASYRPMFLSPSAGPSTFPSTLTSMSEMNDDTTVDEVETNATDLAIGEDNQPQLGIGKVAHDSFTMPRHQDHFAEHAEFDALMHMDVASSVDNSDAGMAHMSHNRPEDETELLPEDSEIFTLPQLEGWL